MDFSSRRHLGDFSILGKSPSPALGLSSSSAPPPDPEQQAQMLAALDALPLLICVIDQWGDTQFSNAAWQEFTGMGASQSASLDWRQCLHAEDLPHVEPLWQQALQTGASFQGEYRLRHHSGAWRWALLSARRQQDARDGSSHWYLSAMDVNDRVLAQQDLYRSVGMQKNMLDVSVDCIKILHPDGTLAHMNKSGCVALGVSPDSGFGQRWLSLLPEEFRAKGQRALNAALKGKNARFAGMSVVPGQVPQHWDNILTPVIGPDGKTRNILCVSRDVSLQREAEQRLRHSSERDELTGLPNRRCFNQSLKRALTAARDAGQCVGLMLLDLDHFKHVNDTLGHPAGDHLLRVLSRRLQNCLPDNAMVARLGGDEFAVIVERITDEQQLHELALKVSRQIEAPISYSRKIINGGMSIGCALYPRDAREAAVLMQGADTALNDLKAGGRGGVRMFNTRIMRATEQAAAQLERAREIVRSDAVQPHYQPKVRLDNGQVVGFEALLRWKSDQGLQFPGTVWAAFQDYELATRLGDVMRTKVLADMLAWREAGLELLPVSLNAAPVEFLRDDYAERLLAQVDEAGLSPRLLEVEVTEHMLGERGSEYVIRALKLLKSRGVRIALDDFGTGQSSLAHLRDYPVDCLKMDSDFVRRICEESNILAIVKTVGHLGPSLSLDLVAEGVETELQRRMLQVAGYEIGQGFLFGAATDAEQTRQFLCAMASA